MKFKENLVKTPTKSKKNKKELKELKKALEEMGTITINSNGAYIGEKFMSFNDIASIIISFSKHQIIEPDTKIDHFKENSNKHEL